MTADACVLSLFAGYGGLDLALEDVLGLTPRYVADIDPGPRKVLAYRYPDAVNLGDVTKVDWSTLTGVRVVCGGSPCQDISTAGKRAGMRAGTRSNLWVEMRDAIATLRPDLVIWENVNAAKSTAAHSDMEPCEGCVGDPEAGGPVLRALGRVLGDLASLGYDAEWLSVPAAAVGCAHLRWRVFVVAWPADAPRNPGWVGHRNRRDAADAGLLGRDQGPGLRPAGTPTGDTRIGRGRPRDDDRATLPAVTLIPTPAVNDMGAGRDVAEWDAWTEKMFPTPSVADAMGGHERRGGPRGDELLLKGVVKALPTWGDYAATIRRAETVFGPAPDPTEEPGDCTCGTPGRSRRLSCRFDEWLMGLPAGWITDVPGVTHAEALKMCGNGVVPAQAAAAIRLCLARADEEAAA